MKITLKTLIISIAKSIDLYNYLLKNHHRRVTIAAYHIGMAMGLSQASISDLVIAASLHDIGALTVEERDQLIKMDVENPQPHCTMGSFMLEAFEPYEKVSNIVYYHHWRYDNANQWNPDKGFVPIEAFILHLADRVEILLDSNIPVLEQSQGIRKTIAANGGALFHPKVVEAFLNASIMDTFWLDIENLELVEVLDLGIDPNFEFYMGLDLIEKFSLTLSKIIDMRSEFITGHSTGVSLVAYHIGKLMGYDEDKCRKLKIAGLLHDVGKIAIPKSLIEKEEPLTAEERTSMRSHAYFTALILRHIPGFEEIERWASGHHENHDGSGYPDHLSENRITEEMDILAYADLYTALSENRPYRDSLSATVILSTLKKDFSERHGTKVLEVIENHLSYLDEICKRAVNDGIEHYRAFEQRMNKENWDSNEAASTH